MGKAVVVIVVCQMESILEELGKVIHLAVILVGLQFYFISWMVDFWVADLTSFIILAKQNG